MPRLKSLELHGYKTFASKTHFEFAEGITSIVGPNGSGKSNIADAIRWVLGEQSYGLLRGKKTEDMIFAGSDQRPRAGMASAVITFDNSDGGLPIDFAEVAIARHAYRDSSNEYLLNDQHVRLKDIDELLARCGLAERTYTIIGQGLVDESLALKPEERRRLFEEAAGIGLYRSRREESLRRLEATQHNLERAQDILAELQPRVRSLERQAKRASEYDVIRQELKDVLRTWYGYHWHAAQEEVARAHVEAQEAGQALEQLRGEQEHSDLRLIELRSTLSGLRTQLNSWHRQAAQLREQREGHGRTLAVSEERLRSLDHSLEEAQAQVAEAQAELAALAQRETLAGEDLHRLHAEAAETRQGLTTAEANRSERESARRERAARREALRTHLNELEAEIVRREARRGQLDERLAQLTDRAAEQRLARDELARQAAAFAEARKDLEAQSQAAQARVREALAELERIHAALGEHQRAAARSQEQLLARTAAVQQLRGRAEVLDQAEREMLGYGAGVRTLLTAQQQGRLPGAIRALGAVLEIPAEYDSAITSALGELLEAMLLHEPQALEAALDMLAQPQAGRASLLPLADLAAPEPLAIPQDAEVIGSAASLVGIEPAYRQAVELLLGQTVVVRTRRAARRLARTLPAQARVVTLEGEVFHPTGAVTAGGGQPPSALSRARERRAIDERARQAAVEREQAELAGQEAETKLRELGRAEVSQHEKIAALENEAQEARSRLEACQAQSAKAESELEWRSRQLAEVEEEARRLRQEQEALASDGQQLQASFSEARTTFSATSITFEDGALGEGAEDIATWSTRLALAEQAAREAHNRFEDIAGQLERGRQVTEERSTRLGMLQHERQVLEQSLSGLRQQESSFSASINETQLLISPAESQLDSTEAELAKLEQTEAEGRAKLHSAEHRYTQAQVQLARRQEELEGLRRRIEDDFGLVEFEYASEVTGPTPLPISELVQHLPHVEQLPAEIEDLVTRRRTQMRRMGAINPEAPGEYREVKERFEFLTAQVADLGQAEAQLRQVIAELDQMMRDAFRKTFEAVAIEFPRAFGRLFGGGSAKLLLTDPENLNDTGIDIQARLPGRRPQPLAVLSGGERSLTAVALVFALLKVAPTPFCVLDEVDAMLDESNVGRFREMLTELSQRTQFVVITHNRNTVQASQVIYGVSMGPDSASQVISLRLDEFASN